MLPPDVAHDQERQARFEREATAISRLTHRHIRTLHDIGREGDTVSLVMERLEGDTLAARLHVVANWFKELEAEMAAR